MMPYSSQHILLIADNQLDGQRVRGMLSTAGHFDVTHVTRLSDAVDHLRACHAVDAGIVDLDLADSSGLDSVRLLCGQAPQLPVIVLTAAADHELELCTVQAGAQELLIKGQFSGGELGRAIRHAIERQRLVGMLNERAKELNGLHAAAVLLANEELAAKDILNQFVAIVPPAMQHPSVAAARASFGDVLAATPNYQPTPWTLQATFHTSDNTAGMVEASYLTEQRPAAEGPFLAEEADLIDSLAEMLRAHFERRQATQLLLNSEERFRMVAGATNDAIWDWDMATDRLWWNEGFETLFGYRRDEVESTLASWTTRVHPDDHERVVPDFRRAAEGSDRTWSSEYRFRRKNGSYAVVLDRGYIMRDANGKAVRMIGGMTDLTEKKQLEARLRQGQKMEAIGHLAGGVAHDFNNLLTVINGYSEMLMPMFTAGDPKREMLAEIRSAGCRAANLTGQLLAFSRKQVLAPQVLDINAVIESGQRMLARLIGEDIHMTTVLKPNLSRIKVDPGQLEQVILNLAVNARDAMPRGGQLTIETAEATVTADDITRKPDRKSGRYVALSVTDTGTGIAPAVMEHIFEPFYTTKDGSNGNGKGTGLGLATVFGIVHQSDGFIDVYSEVGVGTTFKIYFPAVDHQDASAPEYAATVAPDGNETVLLVEDEAAVRGIATLSLQQHGYRVLAATSGKEASGIFEANREAIQLVVTDVVMPGMSGRELVESIKRTKPDIKIIYMSGYTDDAIVRHGILEATDSFLQKPFTPLALAKKVREVLGDPTSRR